MGRLFRILTATIIISAVGIGLSHAETIWEKRQKALKGIEEQQNEAVKEEKQVYTEEKSNIEIPEEIPSGSIDLATITIPDQYGSIIETHEGTNGKLIVNIQDAHANYEAQKNIAGIIEALIIGHNINLILREGNITDKDYSYVRERAPLEERKQKADELLKKGIIAGEDYLNIASDYPMHFQGIEDRNLYNENGDALWEMEKIKSTASEYVNKLIPAADSLKTKIYNNDLAVMDKAKRDYENENMDLLAYYKALYDIVQRKDIDIEYFPNFLNLMKINDLEQKIDLVKIRNNTATTEEKARYDEYQEALRKLNVNKLFKEEPLLENKIQEAISESSDQKILYRISKALSIMDKMLNIKLVPEEYDYFLKNKRDFDPQMWSDFLKTKSDELRLGLNIPNNYYAISDNMPKIEKFYETAVARENTFIKKSEERINKDNAKSAILIAGGFHTPKLSQLLNEMGYSYIVISPKVTTKTDDELYRSTLKRELPKIKEGGE